MADRAGKAVRALSFGAVAAEYDATRPTYPDELLRQAGADGWADVADVGAGTGKLTELLAGRGLAVTAVEPDDGMRRVLAAKLPAITAVPGTGEALPLGDASVDAVTYAQAWHWVDAPAALREAARVLRPGGVLLLVWNTNADVPWTNALHELTHSTATPAEVTEHSVPKEHPGFAVPELLQVEWSEQLTRQHVLDRAATWSYVSTLPEDERADLLAALSDLLDAQPQPLTWTHIALGAVLRKL